jgi:hypothetical protein
VFTQLGRLLCAGALVEQCKRSRYGDSRSLLREKHEIMGMEIAVSSEEKIGYPRTSNCRFAKHDAGMDFDSLAHNSLTGF